MLVEANANVAYETNTIPHFSRSVEIVLTSVYVIIDHRLLLHR